MIRSFKHNLESPTRVEGAVCETGGGGLARLESLEDKTFLSADGSTIITDPVEQMVGSATSAGSVEVTEQQSGLTSDYTTFITQSSGLYAQPDYATVIETSPVAGLISAFQDPLHDTTSQNQNYAQQSEQQALAGEQQTQTVTQQNVPPEALAGSTGGNAGSMFSAASSPSYADMMLQSSGNSGTSQPENSTGQNTDQNADDPTDPRLAWTPLQFPSEVLFAGMSLPAENALGDLSQVAPENNSSFSNTSTIAQPTQLSPTDPSLGTGEKTLDVSTTFTLEQQWGSDENWSVTQTRHNEFRSVEESLRDDNTTDTFDRTGFETLSITVINGTRRIVTWTRSDTFEVGAQNGEDTEKYRIATLPPATTASNTGNNIVASLMPNDTAETDEPQNDSGFESGVRSHAEISISFEEQVITLPDGTLATVYSFGFGTGRSFRSQAEGGYGVKEKEGELKEFPSVLDPENEGSEGQTGTAATGSQNGTLAGPAASPASGSTHVDDPTELPPGAVATKPVEHGGNGSSLDAGGWFRFGAGASTGESIQLSAVVPAGGSLDDAQIFGGTSFFASADTSANVQQSLGFQSQESSGEPNSSSGEHEYLSFTMSDGGGGSKDFHYSVDAQVGGYDQPVPVFGRGEAGSTALLSRADQATPTSAGAVQQFLTAEPLGTDSVESESAEPEPTIDIGFGLNIKNHGNGSSSINFSQAEHPTAFDTIRIGHGSGSSSSFSNDFDLGEDEDGEFKLTAKVDFAVSGGTATGIVRTFVMPYPSNMLQWLGPNAVGFVHKSTTTQAQGKTMSSIGDFTITVGLVGDVDVDATMTAEFNEITTSIQKAENFATFRGADGGLYHVDQTLLNTAVFTLTMSGNLVDGFTTTTSFVPSSSNTVVTTGTPPSTTTGNETSEENTWTTILDATQFGLDIAGLVPGLGEAADLLNAGIHVARGNYGEAALSIAAMVPVLGNAATVGKLGTKATKVATKVASKVDDASALRKADVSTMLTTCSKGGPNCFIAGTQVVVAVPGTTGHQLAGVVPELPTEHTAPAAVLDIDRYFAAAGFMMAAALAVRRKGKAIDRRLRFRWFGRA